MWNVACVSTASRFPVVQVKGMLVRCDVQLVVLVSASTLINEANAVIYSAGPK